jgi:hypothetical protein
VTVWTPPPYDPRTRPDPLHVDDDLAWSDREEAAWTDGYDAGRRAVALGYAAAFVLGGFVVALGIVWIRTLG